MFSGLYTIYAHIFSGLNEYVYVCFMDFIYAHIFSGLDEYVCFLDYHISGLYDYAHVCLGLINMYMVYVIFF